MSPLDINKKAIVEELYDALLHAANRVLHKAKNYSISVLKLENPTLGEIATQFREVAQIISMLADDINDSHTGPKAQEYVECMEGIALAIDADDEDALRKIVNQLDKRPFL